jgi:hypothetical protein
LIEEEVYEKMAQRILILTQGEVSQMEGGGVGRGWVEGGRRVSEGVRPRSPPSGADGDRDGDGEVEGGGGGGGQEVAMLMGAFVKVGCMTPALMHRFLCDDV